MPDDFDRIETVAEFLANEPPGDAIRVIDSAMAPALLAGDIVRLENRPAGDDEVVCLEIAGVYFFGYRDGDVLHRLNGADIHLTEDTCQIGVAVAVIDRELKPRR
ncbi:MAG TPA: hypothetical protein VN380_14435 [Thermoanaerobaculia bacterium]|nr:hypothetical protein [Thermoanaerobaculia bacterium]